LPSREIVVYTLKISTAFYADIAVIQFTYWFNKQNNTSITAFAEIKGGVPFVTIDFGSLDFEIIFKYTLRLGEIQHELTQKDKFSLDYKDFPLPHKDDSNYSFD
jgi:hypothetical protein